MISTTEDQQVFSSPPTECHYFFRTVVAFKCVILFAVWVTLRQTLDDICEKCLCLAVANSERHTHTYRVPPQTAGYSTWSGAFSGWRIIPGNMTAASQLKYDLELKTAMYHARTFLEEKASPQHNTSISITQNRAEIAGFQAQKVQQQSYIFFLFFFLFDVEDLANPSGRALHTALLKRTYHSLDVEEKVFFFSYALEEAIYRSFVTVSRQSYNTRKRRSTSTGAKVSAQINSTQPN
eukprot:gene8652-6079_t